MSRKLVAYFSATGTTAKVAETLADAIGADIYEIEPEVPYTEADLNWRDANSRSSIEMNDPLSRPAIAGKRDNMADYDTIYVGFPIWWYDLPTPVWSFLEEYDLSGKTIIPFFSHAGSSNGANSLNRLTSLATGATVLTDDALSINGDRVNDSETQVKSWAVSVVHK